MEEVSESNRPDSADAATTSSSTTAEGGGGEALSRGLSAMLESVIKDFDSKAIDTLNSQDQLSGSLDRLVQGTIYHRSIRNRLLGFVNFPEIRLLYGSIQFSNGEIPIFEFLSHVYSGFAKLELISKFTKLWNKSKNIIPFSSYFCSHNLWFWMYVMQKKTELDQLLENAPLPFIVQHASRISSVKQRVSSMNLVLKSIQRRIDNIDQMLSANIAQGNVYTHF